MHRCYKIQFYTKFSYALWLTFPSSVSSIPQSAHHLNLVKAIYCKPLGLALVVSNR